MNASELAAQSAANAACIARELLDLAPNHLGTIGNFDNLGAAAVRLAEVEMHPSGKDMWEELCWEDVCGRLADHLVKSRLPISDAVFCRLLKRTSMPPRTEG